MKRTERVFIRKNGRKVIFLLFVLLFAGIATSVANVLRGNKHVLYINSYTLNFPASIDQYQGLQSVLDTTGIVLDTEFMDSKRFPTLSNINSFKRRLSFLLQRSPRYDAIVVSDDYAFRFVIENQNTLFYHIPIFFMGVNDIKFGMTQKDNPWVAGLFEKPSLNGSVELMLHFYPQARKIYIVCDHTLVSVSDYKVLRRLMPRYKNLKYETIWSDQYTTKDFIRKLASLDKRVPLLFEAAYVNRGESMIRSFKESVRLVDTYFGGPVFSTWTYGVEAGALGGEVISFYQHGQIIGRMVKQVLNGGDMAKVKMVPNPPYLKMFNYDVMKKFEIKAAQLPQGAILLNKPLSVYEQNKPLVISAMTFIVILVVMIAFLMWSNLRRKKTSKELILSKNKAEESDRLKSDFIRNVSHEIRTPLNSIVGFTEILSDNPDLKSENESYISVVQDNVKQLMAIIGKVLEISSIESKSDEIVMDQTSIRDVLDDQFYKYLESAKAKGLELIFDQVNNSIDCVIVSDVKKLSKIVSYLLENALKFTSEGSIHIGFNEVKKNKVVIYVKDSGIGISKEQQQVIFGRFVQVEELMSRKFGGMGLGLAIARENAMLLGGNIYVESELGKGSTFFVTLPA